MIFCAINGDIMCFKWDWCNIEQIIWCFSWKLWIIVRIWILSLVVWDYSRWFCVFGNQIIETEMCSICNVICGLCCAYEIYWSSWNSWLQFQWVGVICKWYAFRLGWYSGQLYVTRTRVFVPNVGTCHSVRHSDPVIVWFFLWFWPRMKCGSVRNDVTRVYEVVRVT